MPATAKTRIEIHRGAKVFFDQFNSPGWLASPLGGITYPTDDTVTLTIQAGQVVQNYGKAINVNTNTYNHLVVRVSSVTAQEWQVYLQQEAGGAWIKAASGNSAGIFDVDLSGAFSDVCTGVELVAAGAAGQTVTFDLVSVCKELTVPPDSDAIDELRINWPTLKDGVSGAMFTLLNTEGTYNGLAEHDAVVIYLGRSASPGDKVFGGRIRTLKREAAAYGQYYLHVEAHGHAYELMHPPSRLTYGYVGTNGRAIIEAALACAPSLARYPAGVGWFDYSGAVGSTDDRIASDYDVEFDAENPYAAMMQIADEAANPAGKIGFDIVELPSGCLIGHLRGSLDWVCPVTPKLRRYVDMRDATSVVNRQTVYGAKKRSEPPDGTAWTETTDGWTATYGVLSAVSTLPTPVFGAKCLKCISTNLGTEYTYTAQFKRAYTGVAGKGKAAYSKLNFLTFHHLRPNIAASNYVLLYAPDIFNAFLYNFDENEVSIGWKEHSIALGENNERNAQNPTGKWLKVGSPSWLNLTSVEFVFTWTVPTSYVAVEPCFVAIDALNFSEGPYRGTANNTASQAKVWGVIEAAPESDNTLTSDAACLQRAESLLASKADSQRMIDPVIVDGDAQYRPGDLVTINSVDWVIREVIHVVRNNIWDTELKI